MSSTHWQNRAGFAPVRPFFRVIDSARWSRVTGAPSFELFRALTGRRSSAQIRRYDWTCDPEPYLPAFDYGPFTKSPTDIEE